MGAKARLSSSSYFIAEYIVANETLHDMDFEWIEKGMATVGFRFIAGFSYIDLALFFPAYKLEENRFIMLPLVKFSLYF